VSVFCLGPEQIDNLWPEYGYHLERLEQETKVLLAQALRQDLKEATKQLWGFQDDTRISGVAITTISDTPRGKLCEVVGACGTESSPGQIDAILMRIEQWARDIGCTRVRFGGRRGWMRRLKTYKQVGIILEKEI
jgi:hypothetical protein